MLGMKLYMFRTVRLSIIRSFSLYSQHLYMSYSFADSLWAGSGWNAVPSWSCSQAASRTVWHIQMLCVQWKTPDDGQTNCPKHVEFHSKHKFRKLVHLVCFIVRHWTWVYMQPLLHWSECCGIYESPMSSWWVKSSVQKLHKQTLHTLK